MASSGLVASLGRIWTRDIWQAARPEDPRPKVLGYACLRVVSTTATTFQETRTASRAADLSFSSLLGLGPLIAIAMLVASNLFGARDPNLAVNALNRLISFIAPQLNQYERLGAAGGVQVNPELVAMLNGFIEGARSETAGLVGAGVLIVIVLFLFKAIEDVFNEIWGVRRGRPLLRRVAFYWTSLTLGGLAFFAAVALLGAGTFVNVFVTRLPFGSELVRLLRWSVPAASFALLVAVLAVFYRAIPNTRVRWSAALAGAFAAAVLLSANNLLGFLYLRRVLLTRSLFGSLGLIPILMFGLYIFWMIVLIGGQLSYAVQNVHLRNSRMAWSHLSSLNRERLSLAVLMTVCRRFRAAGPPITVPELSRAVRLPEQVVNECLNRISAAGYVRAVPVAREDAEVGFQPARPLSRITLYAYVRAADQIGADPAGDALDLIDPVVRSYGIAAEKAGAEGVLGRSVEDLLSDEAAAN
jgi:membrane protein